MEVNLLKLAEAFDTALLERRALKEINDYAIEVVPDDSRIEIMLVPVKSVHHIKSRVVLRPPTLLGDRN